MTVWLYPQVAISYSGRAHAPLRLVLHTTETNGPAKYSDGGSAPNVELDPRTKTGRQWFALDRTSRAMATAAVNDGSVQVEIVGWAANGQQWTPDQYEWLVDQLKWITANAGIPWSAPWPWPANGGENVRKTYSQWNAVRGVVGHCHAPGHTHWDPGSVGTAIFNALRLDGVSFPGASAFVIGQSHPAVEVLDQMLIAYFQGFPPHHDGDGYQADSTFTEHTKLNVQRVQRDQGWTGEGADGIPGPVTWQVLRDATPAPMSDWGGPRPA
jgi:hypothetical protein